ncbi:MAG: hypothetical protein E7774_01880 [Bradyrhizobium sp.]|nr:MAG: hypothetical protein E7774_01880 [Bradyrhizobium sp.]
MTMISKLFLAGAFCAAIAAGALAANAGASDATHAKPSASVEGVMVGLNPQPLPPGDRQDDEDDFLRG